MAVKLNTPINGIAVVTGVRDDIAGMSCNINRHKK